eukprot:TRINITY_DN1618_c0_g1_i11.p2 TRINITY_DN1618_c0_g1~~TRINITY_DN1618_c0_g1_i11.p2  ORF type:complete len:214 (+),score=28.91 TRINITY_DN1618_c0_g1_i11:290-931(+)
MPLMSKSVVKLDTVSKINQMREQSYLEKQQQATKKNSSGDIKSGFDFRNIWSLQEKVLNQEFEQFQSKFQVSYSEVVPEKVFENMNNDLSKFHKDLGMKMMKQFILLEDMVNSSSNSKNATQGNNNNDNDIKKSVESEVEDSNSAQQLRKRKLNEYLEINRKMLEEKLEEEQFENDEEEDQEGAKRSVDDQFLLSIVHRLKRLKNTFQSNFYQ